MDVYGRRNSNFKGPEEGMHLVFEEREPDVAGVCPRGRAAGEEVSEGGGPIEPAVMAPAAVCILFQPFHPVHLFCPFNE